MKLTGIHLLITYKCDRECHHCFVFGSPGVSGAMPLSLVERVLAQAAELKSVREVYFEGGEPFLYYPLVAEGMRLAAERGFRTGVVTNAYWATTPEDAELWLRPLRHLEFVDFSVSCDELHGDISDMEKARNALAAAERLRIASRAMSLDSPGDSGAGGKVMPEEVEAGSVCYRGRAAERLSCEVPARHWEDLRECPHEDLRNPKRVHIDQFGNVHLCQGLLLGNVMERSLLELVVGYDPDRHPVAGPLLRGGPAQLVRELGLGVGTEFADECHLCYCARVAARDRFPGLLGPGHVYGEDEARET